MEDNWLSAQIIDCPQCKEKLYRVDHSPFFDSDFFYCDSCTKRVEISFYDNVRKQILSKFGDNIKNQYQNIQEVENDLRPCDCGGNFKYHAPRRCIYCAFVVIDEGGGIDIYPGCTGINEDKEPTEEEQKEYEKFETEFIRTKNIWK